MLLLLLRTSTMAVVVERHEVVRLRKKGFQKDAYLAKLFFMYVGMYVCMHVGGQAGTVAGLSLSLSLHLEAGEGIGISLDTDDEPLSLSLSSCPIAKRRTNPTTAGVPTTIGAMVPSEKMDRRSTTSKYHHRRRKRSR